MKVGDDTPSSNCKMAVVVVNYYSARYLQRCLACVAAQSVAPYRVIIVNNGDHQGALDFIPSNYPSWEVISPGNIGFAAANNRALQILIDSKWIALLNPDAFPEEDWLATLIEAATRAPDVNVFSSQLYTADDAGIIDGEGDCYHMSGIAWRINHNRTAQNALRGTKIFSPCAAAAMYRRSALLDIGGFDENYFCYFEDVDLGFRLRLRGYEVKHVPESIVYHVGGGSSKSAGLSDFAIYYGHRNLVWTFVKNMPGHLFWIFLPAHILMNLAAIAYFALKGKAGIILRAKRDAILQLPRVWHQRREIQRSRKASPAAILKCLTFGLIR